MASYPAVFDVQRPAKFERSQVFLRIVLIVLLSVLPGLLGWVFQPVGWVFGLVYLLFPVIAAIFISQKGSAGYLSEEGQRIGGWIRWLMAFYAYMLILVDTLPTEKPERFVTYDVRTGGSPTVGSALLRIIYAIPSAFVLALLGIVSGVIWIIALIMVLVQETYPEGLYNFQLGVARWQARLFTYLASLVQEYPPFSLDTGHEPGLAPGAGGPVTAGQ